MGYFIAGELGAPGQVQLEREDRHRAGARSAVVWAIGGETSLELCLVVPNQPADAQLRAPVGSKRPTSPSAANALLAGAV